MQGVASVSDFADPAILPSGPVRVAALDGENADPASALTLELGLLAHSPWDEMAYRLPIVDAFRALVACPRPAIWRFPAKLLALPGEFKPPTEGAPEMLLPG